MKALTLSLMVAAGVIGFAAGASAQSPSGTGIGVRGLATFGVSQMTASESFETILGSKSLVDFGGGGQVTNLWRGLYVEALFNRSRETGERVFVDGTQVFPLGIPLIVTLTTVDVTGGYRFNRGSRLVPYVGGGYTSAGYKETSSFAQAGDDVDDRFGGFVVLGGVEVRALRWLHVRGEARYRQIPDALGEGGVSTVYDEDDLGGFRMGVLVAVGR